MNSTQEPKLGGLVADAPKWEDDVMAAVKEFTVAFRLVEKLSTDLLRDEMMQTPPRLSKEERYLLNEQYVSALRDMMAKRRAVVFLIGW